MENKVTPAWQKGLILSLIIIVIGAGLHLSGMSQNTYAQWSQNILFFAGIIWACIDYAKQKQGEVTFGNVFGFGFKVSAAVAAIVAVYSILAVTTIFPEMKDQAIEAARKSMEDNPKLNEEQIDQALQMTSKMFVPFMIGGVLLGFALIGAIASLVGAAFAKKNPNPTPFNQ
ncbi:MAG: DUF4199 domain-containing protein [Sediminibacterium sp.]|jgi:hypothetical protein|nr:DUF4199 domain-containing protein [Sediminibacterium sp.]